MNNREKFPSLHSNLKLIPLIEILDYLFTIVFLLNRVSYDKGCEIVMI